MNRMPAGWDYLILTASNARQAQAYEAQLDLRRGLGLLARIREEFVVADPEGKRVGSGGSTLHCLALVLNRERRRRGTGAADVEESLRGLRILIVHAGGDSRRLPAYGSCGKIFIPLPGESHSAVASTLFDRLVPSFLDLPCGPPGKGQVVVAAGDALIRFDPTAVRLDREGMTVLGCYASPEEASRHGVFCASSDGTVRLYLQKPTPAEQARQGAINRFGKTILDAGVMSFDAATATALLKTFGIAANASGDLAWTEPMGNVVLSRGLDLYREICCAMGTEATPDHFLKTAWTSGSGWDEATLLGVFGPLREIPLRVQALPQPSFLHFGSTGQLVASGLALVTQDSGAVPAVSCLMVNSEVTAGGSATGPDSWVEGCRLSAPLALAGRNVVAGVEVSAPLELPEGACLDVLHGRSRRGDPVWFVRCYGVNDGFKEPVHEGAEFCGRPLPGWLAAVGAASAEIWPDVGEAEERSLWNARVFPAETEPDGYRNWLWMFEVDEATPEQKRAFLAAERYSAAEIAVLADPELFQRRRARIRAGEVRRSLARLFSRESAFSADDLAFVMAGAPQRAAWAADLLGLAQTYVGEFSGAGGMDSFVFCRVVHSLASATARLSKREDQPLGEVLPGLEEALPEGTRAWMDAVNVPRGGRATVADWTGRLRSLAFRRLSEAIVTSSLAPGDRPRNALRTDETIWGRAPARIELGGGWTDTPPYTLEHGGDVINAAVNLNGQPPIHCYCRVVEDPVIRLSSIDGGEHIEITRLEELLDYRRPEDRFALAKAALAISGFSPQTADWRDRVTLREMLEEFGGGLELTTLVGIPKGSGLGTSSILGAVIMAVIRRMTGHPQSQRELFHDVLRLEQALTTGGGWQDQIGGGVGGTKITSTNPGLIPDPRIHYVPSDIVDPKANGGTTLLYYTGLTRLAKNILQQIVGGYLNRDRGIMAALAEEHQVARSVADAMSRKDAAALGHYIDAAWELQKRLCGAVTNEAIECLLARVRPHVHGTRISGAGSGGFLLMIAKSRSDAARVREMLEREPLNERSRFFDFESNQVGLEVTTC